MKFLAALFVLMSLFTATDAAAALCTDFNSPKRFVGDMASDSACTDNSIQSAIDWVKDNPATCPWKIFVTSEITHSNLALSISDTGQSITFVGQGPGVVCGTTDIVLCPPEGCPPPPTNPAVTISGASGNSVFHIDGNNYVTLRYLTIRGGAVLQQGGGIFDGGYGSLTLDTSVITGNEAADGGGIAISPSGGHLDVNFADNVLVLANTATDSGGGVHIEGDATVTIEGAGSLIGLNHALNGYGGGISIAGAAKLNVGSPGYNGLGIVHSNDAEFGGGIAAFATDDGGGQVNLYTVDPLHPVRVDNNFARQQGGAFYAKGHAGSHDNYGGICATSFRIDANAAPEGAVAYLDWDSDFENSYRVGSSLVLNACSKPQTAQPCAANTSCNTITDNVTEDENGNATSGNLITVGLDGGLSLNTFDMRRNRAGTLIAYDFDTYYQPQSISTCVIADNTTTGLLLSVFNYAGHPQSMDGCTIAGNDIGADYVGGITTLSDSIIVQPGKTFQALDAQYVIADDITQLPSSPTVRKVSDPHFVDAANGDYHLQITSLAVDFAGGKGGVDLDGRPRDIDLNSVANIFGPRDLGAYELQRPCGTSDTIFCDGFETD